jgi:S-DNA-T family DNA segregation ATPase FtsK/SpoIIIE
VSDREIDSIARYWKAARDQAALEGSSDAEASTAPWASFVGQEEHDELLDRALQLLQTKKQVSTSLLQRQLRIGYPRAARLMEQLEEMDAVGPDEGGGRSREVLLSSGGQAEAL